MTPEYLLAISLCGGIGYWAVSFLLGKVERRLKTGNAQEQTSKSRPHNGGTERNDSNGDCFYVLGISPSASTLEIKAAYRRKLNMYHPDRVAGLGAELRSVAEEKTKELNAAYAEAMKARR